MLFNPKNLAFSFESWTFLTAFKGSFISRRKRNILNIKEGSGGDAITLLTHTHRQSNRSIMISYRVRLCLGLFFTLKGRPAWSRASKNYLELLMFLSTEIFSKRRKIYTIWRETRVNCGTVVKWPTIFSASCSSLMVHWLKKKKKVAPIINIVWNPHKYKHPYSEDFK